MQVLALTWLWRGLLGILRSTEGIFQLLVLAVIYEYYTLILFFIFTCRSTERAVPWVLWNPNPT